MIRQVVYPQRKETSITHLMAIYFTISSITLITQSIILTPPLSAELTLWA